MKPYFIAIGLLSGFGIGSQALAGEVVSPSVSPANSEKTAKPLAGRKRWEAMLAKPAELDFGDRKTVPIREILGQLREKHQLSMRLDGPTIASLVGAESIHAGTAFRPASRGYAPSVVNIDPSAGPAYAPVRQPMVAPSVPVVLTNAEGDTPASAAVVSESNPKAEDDAEEKPSSESPAESGNEDSALDNALESCLDLEVNVQTINLREVSIGTILRHSLDTMPLVIGADMLEMPLPISLTNACLLDYVVEDDGLLITTRMAALATKETRVYSVKKLKDATPEQIAKIIRQTIRPWSWRTQINEFGDQLRGNVAIPASIVTSAVTTGVQLAASEVGATVTTSEDPESVTPPETLKANNEAEQLGNAAVNGMVMLAQASLSALEMFHYGEFPTATIQTMPGKLIIRQSQAAHREITDLLQQLSDAE